MAVLDTQKLLHLISRKMSEEEQFYFTLCKELFLVTKLFLSINFVFYYFQAELCDMRDQMDTLHAQHLKDKDEIDQLGHLYKVRMMALQMTLELLYNTVWNFKNFFAAKVLISRNIYLKVGHCYYLKKIIFYWPLSQGSSPYRKKIL